MTLVSRNKCCSMLHGLHIGDIFSPLFYYAHIDTFPATFY